MKKISTAVIIGIVCVVMLGIVIWLNRDKFSKEKPAVSPEPSVEPEVPAGDDTEAGE